ncbi:hypothetical protein [Streptomyces sp. NPDC058955]
MTVESADAPEPLERAAPEATATVGQVTVRPEDLDELLPELELPVQDRFF